MKISSRMLRSASVAVVLVLLLAPPPLHAAQAAENQWQFSVMPYLWFPSIEGTIQHTVTGSGGSPSVDIKVNPDDYLGDLDFALLFAAEARKGKWSILTDITYMKLSGDTSNVRAIDFNVGPGPINPISTTLNSGTNSTLESTIWTLAGGYNVVHTPAGSLDLIAGVRYFRLEITTNWRLTATVMGPGGGAVFPATGTISDTENLWDGIVGVRGRVNLGKSKWYVPYYVDVGKGSSEQTWQAQLGVGYAFRWGDLVLGYRYLAYENDDSTKPIQDLKFGGFGAGAIFHF